MTIATRKDSKIVMNTTMLTLMNIAKLVFPMLTLPYLTRVLTVECYGVVAYVKSIMTYMQVFVDFGFVLSATKNIVENRDDLNKVGEITGDALAGKIVLCGIGSIVLIPMVLGIKILRGYGVYVALSQVVIFLSCFFVEYLFRGLEQMHMITIRFVVMKAISSSLTFVFVKSDSDILWIPLLDIISYAIAAILTFIQVHQYGIKIHFTGGTGIVASLRISFMYFLSNMASTVFNVLNTLLIGIYANSMDVAYWSVCLQLISAVQNLYSPISDGIYPEMVKTRDFRIISKVLKIFMPLISVGCIFTIFVAEYVLIIVGGKEYGAAAPILKMLTPVLFFSFLTYMFGFPALGAIGRVNKVTQSTIISALLQILGLVILIITNEFSILYVAALRSFTEFSLAIMRGVNCLKYKKEFLNV